MSKVAKFWEAMGGRKMGNGYLFCLLATIMIFPLGGTFLEYVAAIGSVLVATNVTVAYEDQKKAQNENQPTPNSDQP